MPRDADFHLLHPKPKAWKRGLAWLLAALFVLYATSFVLFAEGRRAQAISNNPTPQADGIVVLTGSSRIRIEEGLRLMGEKRGRRLLISGVNENVSMETILNFAPAMGDKIKCCVDLDYRAGNTVGNAVEARLWARIQGYRSLIIVTSTHHIPRTLIEMRRVMPNIRLIAHPINPQGVKLEKWWQYPGTFSLLLGEYTRYLFALFNLGGAHNI